MGKKRKRRSRRRSRSRGMPSWLPIALVSAVVILVVGGFIVLYLSSKPGSQKASCSLIIDRTNSVLTPETTSVYHRLANDAVTQCSQLDGTLTLWAIQQSGVQSEMKGTWPLYGVGRNGPIRDRSKSQEEAAANQAISSVLSEGAGNKSGGSNIVGAINAAAATMNNQSSQSGVTAKYMVVLTDGMQLSDGVSVKSLSSITDDPRVLVNNALRVESPFSVHGINISFLGVKSGQMASNGQQLPLWFEQKVGIFWSELVRVGQGKSCLYSNDTASGVVLLNCGAK